MPLTSIKSIKGIGDLNINKNSKVLLIYPHPDDETVFSAGLILLLLHSGIYVKIISLSEGEASTLKYGVDLNQNLEDVRRGEFESVCKLFGVENYTIENIPDGEFHNNEEKIRDYLKEITKGFDVVVTFEPNGVYGHSDHKSLSKLITELHKENNNFTLIYSTIKRWYKSLPVNPLKPSHKLTLQREDIVLKGKALKLYESQFKFSKNHLKYLIYLYLLRNEYFYLVDQ